MNQWQRFAISTPRLRCRLVVLSLICVLVATAASATPDAAPLAEESEDRVTRLVVMLEGQLGQASMFGAGFVFARDGDAVLIATANHVVRRGSRSIAGLKVRFAERPETPLSGELLDDFDLQLDLAVIRVTNLAAASIEPCARGFDRVGRGVQRGDPVLPLGNPSGWRWALPVEPAHVAQATDDEIRFESTFLAPGSSGGALLSADFGLLGMVVSDQPPLGTAKRIEPIRDRLRGWGYPFHLYHDPVGRESPLDVAIQVGDVAQVQALINGCARLQVPEGYRAPLTVAIDAGNADIVDRLISAGAPMRYGDLHRAVGSIPVLQRLLQEKPDLGDDFSYALHRRTQDDQQALQALQVLLDHGWHPPVNALREAIRNKNWRAVRAFLQLAVVDVNWYDADADSYWASLTPLQMAIENNDTEIVHLLVEAGAHPNLRGKHKLPPWLQALNRELSGPGGKHIETARYLLSVGGLGTQQLADNEDFIRSMRMMEQKACYDGRLDILDLLWQVDYPVFSYWFTCVTDVLGKVGPEAALRVAETQIARGADPNIVYEYDSDGSPAWRKAFELEQPVFAQLLIESGADIDSTAGPYGRCATHFAAENGWTDVVRLLLERGAGIEPLDLYMCTPLALAADGGHLDTVTLLLRGGAAPTTYRDGKGLGCQPLAMAIRGGHIPVVKALLGAGADTSVERNRAYIDWASLRGSEELARALGVENPNEADRPPPVDLRELSIPFQ